MLSGMGRLNSKNVGVREHPQTDTLAPPDKVLGSYNTCEAANQGYLAMCLTVLCETVTKYFFNYYLTQKTLTIF